MSYDLNEVMRHFKANTDVSPYGEGHINDTFLADSAPHRYLLQRINHNIFKDVDGLMNNIVAVTDYLREIITKEGGDPDRETLTVIRTTDDKNYYCSPEGKYYRMYIYMA
ncbi:MAG: hypothetical protein II978_03630 [Clostridia bacterium]|nr:hypothetical protein [Clostridia bacterium]